MSTVLTLRLVILPTALRLAMPSCAKEIILMVKGIAQGLISPSDRAIEVSIAAAAICLFINFLIVRALAYMEICMTPYRARG